MFNFYEDLVQYDLHSNFLSNLNLGAYYFDLGIVKLLMFALKGSVGILRIIVKF